MKFENPIEMFPTGSIVTSFNAIETPPPGYANLYLTSEGYLVAKFPDGLERRIRHD